MIRWLIWLVVVLVMLAVIVAFVAIQERREWRRLRVASTTELDHRRRNGTWLAIAGIALALAAFLSAAMGW